MWSKKQCELEGVEYPSHSDAIRWLKNKYDENKPVQENEKPIEKKEIKGEVKKDGTKKQPILRTKRKEKPCLPKRRRGDKPNKKG